MISSDWRRAALRVGINNDKQEDYAQKYSSNENRMMQVINKWIEIAGTDEYPMSWQGLIELLEDIERGSAAEELKKALAAKGVKIE